jgi:hypothetical protein
MQLVINGFARGSFVIERGSWTDYLALEHLHYRAGRPVVPVGVWRVRFRAPGTRRLRLVAVGVLNFPTLACRAREAAIGLAPLRPLRRRATPQARARWIRHRAARIRWINRHVRRISRIIVAPPFRTLGLGSALARRMCWCCKTRYVEALAVMGRVSPLFVRAGMTPAAITPAARARAGAGAVYYLYRQRRRGVSKAMG